MPGLGHHWATTAEGPPTFDPGGDNVDADVVAQFQFTGQDIPWHLGVWARPSPT